MHFLISPDNQKILDSILPYFRLGEVIDIKKSIRESMASKNQEVHNFPLGYIADTINEFLLKYSFAINASGGAKINSRGIALKDAHSLYNFHTSLHQQHDYIVIDDDSINNHICTSIIHNANENANVKTFTDPNVALRYIQANYSSADANEAIILLDITMPTLLGWEVLDEIKSFPEMTQNHFKIFMLTSSVNPHDKERAFTNPYLWGYIEKPLTVAHVQSLLHHEDPFSKLLHLREVELPEDEE